MSATYDAPAGAKSAWPAAQDGSDYNAHGFGADEKRTHCGRRMSDRWILADTSERPVDCPRCLAAIARAARETPWDDMPSDAELELLKGSLKSAMSRQLYALRHLASFPGDASAQRRFAEATTAAEAAYGDYYGTIMTAAAPFVRSAAMVAA
jgi:hypothetical protein